MPKLRHQFLNNSVYRQDDVTEVRYEQKVINKKLEESLSTLPCANISSADYNGRQRAVFAV
jgi:hypothetical protein